MHDSSFKVLFLKFLNGTPLFIALLAVSIAVVFEAFYSVEAKQPMASKLLNMVNLIFISITNFVVLLTLGVFFNRMHIGLIDLRFTEHNLLTGILSVFVLLFVNDVFYYFYHFTMHKVSHLWDIHAVHHSEVSFNVTMAVRRHWFEDPMQTAMISLPMFFLFKLPVIDMPIVVLLYSLHVYFTHMNLRLQLGRFTWLITAPQLHRLHHSVLPQHTDTNFAQVFPIIDMAFGTYIAPNKNEFPPTGLHSQERVETLREMLLWPFIQWKKKLKKSAAKPVDKGEASL